MTPRLVVAGLILAGLALSARAQGSAALLTRDEAALLRRAVLESEVVRSAADPVEGVMTWLRGESSSAPIEIEALSGRIQTDANLRKAILELAGRRQSWRFEPRGAFIAWWDPRQQDEAGNASTGLSAEDAALLTDFLESLGRELAIPVPRAVPYVIDLRPGTGRVRGPRALRWGIVTPHPRDRAAVAKLLLLEAGSASFVVEPLSRIRACEDRQCRRELLDRARGVVIRSGYVPILEGLRASAFAEEDDPALASALLVIDRIDRLHPGRTFSALLAALETAEGATGLRSAFFRATGEAPGRLDNLVQAELSEWARARERAEAQGQARRPRPGPPPRSW